jgi:hemerythrin
VYTTNNSEENGVRKKPVDKIERVVWLQAYSVHVEEIDREHRVLFSIVNRIADLYESGSNDVFPVLQDLVQYAMNHFHSEHTVMLKSSYPAFVKHSKEHNLFIEKAQTFLRDYETKDKQLVYNMLQYFRNWLFQHTTNIDMKYGEHLASKGMTGKL